MMLSLRSQDMRAVLPCEQCVVVFPQGGLLASAAE